MNANKRTKYATTPTFGMQKRGFPRNVGTAAEQGGTPDFTQLPTPGLPMMPQQWQMPAQQTPFIPVQGVGGYYQQQNAPSYQPTNMGVGMQASFSMPSYMQQSQGQASSVPLPIGNTAPAVPQSSFSPRQQGYVPPSVSMPSSTQPAYQPVGTMVGNPYGGPSYGMAPSPYPQQGYGMSNVAFQPQQNMQPMSGAMPMNGPMGYQQPMLSQAPPPTPYPGAADDKDDEKQPMDKKKMFLFFLFGFLPILFIPCLFVPASLDLLRYAFIALCVGGLGVMWYKQMFTSPTRMTVSILYAALCIVLISMLVSGGADPQTAVQDDPATVQTANGDVTPDGEDALGAGVPTQTPRATAGAPIGLGESIAEIRLTAFMNYWKDSQYEKMVTLVQPSWTQQREKAPADLFQLLANRTPENFELEGINGSDQDNTRTITMSATINKNNNKESAKYRFEILMVKEADQWYVDPKTLSSSEEIESTDDGETAAVTTKSLATAAPRTTVTPVPPPSTKLYYNSEGGKFYHADPNCSSIKEEFLPLAGSFMYSELKTYQATLQPCLKCSAPVNALPDDQLSPSN